MKFELKLPLSKHLKHQILGSICHSETFWTCFQPKNLILTNLLSNCDVAQKKAKSDFLAKIVTFEANFKFFNETTVDSLLIKHVGIV